MALKDLGDAGLSGSRTPQRPVGKLVVAVGVVAAVVPRVRVHLRAGGAARAAAHRRAEGNHHYVHAPPVSVLRPHKQEAWMVGRACERGPEAAAAAHTEPSMEADAADQSTTPATPRVAATRVKCDVKWYMGGAADGGHCEKAVVAVKDSERGAHRSEWPVHQDTATNVQNPVTATSTVTLIRANNT